MNVSISKVSKIGEYNAACGQENQDVICKRENTRFAAVVLADGATTSRCAKKGAQIASRTAAEFFIDCADELFTFSEEKIAYLLIELIRFNLEKEAVTKGNLLTDYSSTLILCGMDKTDGRMLALNLGDGAVVCWNKSGTLQMLKPKRYEGWCCTTTTEKAYKSAQVMMGNIAEQQIMMIISDGAIDELYGGAEGMCYVKNHTDVLEMGAENIRAFLKKRSNSDDCSLAMIYPTA